MKLMLALLVLSHSAFAIDSGDGSDGACNVTGGADTQITSSKRLYQCSSLNLDANLDDFSGAQAGAGGAPLIIKVQGNVTVAVGVVIDLSGANGVAGDNTMGVKAGGLGGAGGSKGGNSPGTGVDGLNGSGSGAGLAGIFVTPFGVSSYGGGGGGGSYKTVASDQGIDGDDIGGSGTVPNSGGANGVIFGNESAFDSSFVGGSGGASGGGGQDAGTPISGSTGGGGGGAIRIIAGGNITVNGSIISSGGNGGGIPATGFAGGGGAGSGGAIWLQAGGDLTVSASGTITAFGGLKGENDSAINGGDGGDGRIRLDDGDGVINVVSGATIGPTPYSTTFTPSVLTSGTNSISRQYASEVSCASVALDDQKPFNTLINLVLGLVTAGLLHLFVSRKSKV